jgi:2-haloacid dehalogenase
MINNRRSFISKVIGLSAAAYIPYIPTSLSNNMNPSKPSSRPKLLIFDVNETLLDLSPMKDRMNDVFRHEYAFKQWFALMLQYSLVDNVTGQYHNFGEIGKAAFKMTENILEKKISDTDMEETLKMIRSLPAHPDVKEGLTLLQNAGYRMVTLTNSTEEVVNQQMEAAGLSQYFERVMSIDSYLKYKPALETYTKTTEILGVKPSEAMLIAAHGWDVTGALHAGLQAAFIDRPGQVQYPLAPEVQVVGDNIITIANQLVKLKKNTLL